MNSIFSKMEDNLNLFKHRRRPQFFQKWKTTSILWKREDNLIFLEKYFPHLLNSKPNPPILGFSTAQVIFVPSLPEWISKGDAKY